MYIGLMGVGRNNSHDRRNERKTIKRKTAKKMQGQRQEVTGRTMSRSEHSV